MKGLLQNQPMKVQEDVDAIWNTQEQIETRSHTFACYCHFHSLQVLLFQIQVTTKEACIGRTSHQMAYSLHWEAYKLQFEMLVQMNGVRHGMQLWPI